MEEYQEVINNFEARVRCPVDLSGAAHVLRAEAGSKG